MAAEQLSRNRDNKTEIHVEKERVPQLASHFEAIAVQQGKATEPPITVIKPTISEKKEDVQRASGSSKVGEGEEIQRIEGHKPEETHELGAQFESLADKVRGNRDNQRDRQASAGEGQKITEKAGDRQVRAGEEQRIAEKTGHQQARAGEEHRQARAGEERRITEKIGEEQRDSKQKISDQAKRNEGEMGSRQNQPALEEISNYRALAQERSNEAIRAAKERFDKESSLDTETKEAATQKHTEQQAGLETVKETLTSAAKTAKEYTAPIAEKAKDYTVTAGQTTAQFLGSKAAAAKDVAIESGKVAAEYAGKAAEELKEKAVVAGWSTAHYSCDTAVEGTKAAARLVKGAAEYAVVKPLSAAKNVAESAGENVKEYTARKKEEAQRESMHKKGEKESFCEEGFEGGKEKVKERDDDDGGGILGAIGETIYEIAQTTKEIVIGGDETEKQRSVGFELGQGEEEEQEHGHEKEYYQTGTRKETRAL